jgi:hypothetical protein
MGCGCQGEKEDDVSAVATRQALLEIIEEWIARSDDGKKWLSEMAAKVGVPLQIALPLKGSTESAAGAEENHEDRRELEGRSCCGPGS